VTYGAALRTVVSFCWERPGEPFRLRLLHTAGQQANIILLDTHGIILDALKYVPRKARHVVLFSQVSPINRCLCPPALLVSISP
jgi:hypothetical protein